MPYSPYHNDRLQRVYVSHKAQLQRSPVSGSCRLLESSINPACPLLTYSIATSKLTAVLSLHDNSSHNWKRVIGDAVFEQYLVLQILGIEDTVVSSEDTGGVGKDMGVRGGEIGVGCDEVCAVVAAQAARGCDD